MRTRKRAWAAAPHEPGRLSGVPLIALLAVASAGLLVSAQPGNPLAGTDVGAGILAGAGGGPAPSPNAAGGGVRKEQQQAKGGGGGAGGIGRPPPQWGKPPVPSEGTIMQVDAPPSYDEREEHHGRCPKMDCQRICATVLAFCQARVNEELAAATARTSTQNDARAKEAADRCPNIPTYICNNNWLLPSKNLEGRAELCKQAFNCDSSIPASIGQPTSTIKASFDDKEPGMVAVLPGFFVVTARGSAGGTPGGARKEQQSNVASASALTTYSTLASILIAGATKSLAFLAHVDASKDLTSLFQPNSRLQQALQGEPLERMEVVLALNGASYRNTQAVQVMSSLPSQQGKLQIQTKLRMHKADWVFHIPPLAGQIDPLESFLLPITSQSASPWPGIGPDKGPLGFEDVDTQRAIQFLPLQQPLTTNSVSGGPFVEMGLMDPEFTICCLAEYLRLSQHVTFKLHKDQQTACDTRSAVVFKAEVREKTVKYCPKLTNNRLSTDILKPTPPKIDGSPPVEGDRAAQKEQQKKAAATQKSALQNYADQLDATKAGEKSVIPTGREQQQQQRRPPSPQQQQQQQQQLPLRPSARKATTPLPPQQKQQQQGQGAPSTLATEPSPWSKPKL